MFSGHSLFCGVKACLKPYLFCSMKSDQNQQWHDDQLEQPSETVMYLPSSPAFFSVQYAAPQVWAVGGRSGEEVGAKKFPQEARRAASRGLLLTGPTITA